MNSQHPSRPSSPEDQPVSDPTVDLSFDEFEVVDDLQALADEVAESTEELAAASGKTLEELEAALSKAQTRIQELEKSQAEHGDKHHRLLADFANHRNRAGRDIQMAVTLAERKLLMEFLPVIDSFERCLGSTYSNLDDFHSGISLIHKQFVEALRKVGVEGVDLKIGDPFDAMHAEALTTTRQSNLPDGAVAAIYERGFMLRDQLLRPARVIVNHNDETEADLTDPGNSSSIN